MDAYPKDYTNHEFPLIVLSGLIDTSPSDLKGPVIDCSTPIVETDITKLLIQDFKSLQAQHQEWTGKATRNKNGLIGYNFNFVGRKYVFPSRKANPPGAHYFDTATKTENDGPKSPSQSILHSRLSPLSPESHLFPDGVFTPEWIDKHQNKVPSIFIAFFDFSSDQNLNTLRDNELKTAISGTRASLQQSEYRSKFAVVLLSDKTIVEAPEIEERISNIRRGTGLDAKTGIFFLPTKSSRVEITSFVTNLLTTLQPVCIEYYRDLTKHSRRKKNKGTIPPPTVPPTTTSQPLSTHGWNIRYDVKLGILAEFRQEMDSACRHYTLALEALMGSEGVFETTPSWSSRWDEGRLLADMLAFRILRCLLWSQMATTATQSWVNYKDRMHEIVDRRGKGSSNYGWEAWESRWAKVMADLIQRADIPAISVMDSIDMTQSMILAKTENTTYLQPERTFTGVERIPPWHHMHHFGYWMRLSAKHAKRRLRYANAIPEEDRETQRTPSASQKSKPYDTYLCPEPFEEFPASENGFNHSADILDKLKISTTAFNERKQRRFAERLQVEMARELLRQQRYQEAVDLLKSIWTDCSWRKENWWLPLFELNRLLNECAKHAGDIEMVVSTTFELYSSQLRMMRDMKVDLMGCAASLGVDESESRSKSIVKLSPTWARSFLNMSYVFGAAEGNVGVALPCQIKVSSNAHSNTAPVTLSRIYGQFKSNRYSFEITHTSTNTSSSQSLSDTKHGIKPELIDLTDSITSESSDDGHIIFKAEANLTFSPGRVVIFGFALDLKEPGELELDTIRSEIVTEEYQLIYDMQPTHFSQPLEWYSDGESKLTRKRIGRSEPWIAEIRPKPPKLDVQILNLDRSIYTDEPVSIDFEVTNGEEEAVTAKIDVRILSRGTPPEISWIHSDETESKGEDDSQSSRSITLPLLDPGNSLTRTATFISPSTSIDLILESKIHYFMPTDPEIPLSKTFTTNLSINLPFEANYNFTPRVHPKPWPSYFSINNPIPGLLQQWNLSADVASFANEDLVLQKVSFEIDKKPSTLETTLVKDLIEDGSTIQPRTMRNFNFILDTTRPSAKEHRSMSLTAKLLVTWSRTVDSTPITSTLLVSPLQLPPLEPRIIATLSQTSLSLTKQSSTKPSTLPIANLLLTLENPTGHPLTFDMTVPSSDTFAFSGAKQQSVTLVPYSRSDVDFRLVPLVRNGWVNFGVKVVDRWFVREVDVLPGQGVKAGEETGGVMWWVD